MLFAAVKKSPCQGLADENVVLERRPKRLALDQSCVGVDIYVLGAKPLILSFIDISGFD